MPKPDHAKDKGKGKDKGGDSARLDAIESRLAALEAQAGIQPVTPPTDEAV